MVAFELGLSVYWVATHLENPGRLTVVREKSGKKENSGKMCSCMYEIWPVGSQENH